MSEMTQVNNGRAAHLDLDAKRAARQAAVNDGLRYSFTFGGREFELLPANDWPANVKFLMSEGDVAEVIDSIVDDPQAFWAVRPRATVQDVSDIVEAWSDWAGTGSLPNSETSQRPASTPT